VGDRSAPRQSSRLRWIALSNVIGADGCSHCADVALASRALKQLDEPSTRVPLPAVGRLDRVPDLDHAGGIGWTVVTGPADGQHALRVPNHTGDPPCAARVVQNLRTSSAPYSTPLGTSEVAGHRYSGGRVRRSQVAASKGVQRGRTQLHDPNSSHLARRGIPSLIDVGHLPTIPDTARDQKASSRIAGTRSLTDQGSAYGTITVALNSAVTCSTHRSANGMDGDDTMQRRGRRRRCLGDPVAALEHLVVGRPGGIEDSTTALDHCAGRDVVVVAGEQNTVDAQGPRDDH